MEYRTILSNIEAAIKAAITKEIPIVLIQHVVDPEMGIAPFFNEGSEGAANHPRILEAAQEAKVIVKQFADSFFRTKLEEVLSGLGATELVICGVMTQNCVTHTAILKSAKKYKVSIQPECCTAVDEVIHNIELHAVSTRVPLVSVAKAI